MFKGLCSPCNAHSAFPVQGTTRMTNWFKAKQKLFTVNAAGLIVLKHALRLKPSQGQGDVPAPPGFAPGRKPTQTNQVSALPQNGTDQRLALLEEKIIKWLSKRQSVSTTEMAEFAYSSHEDLVPGEAVCSCSTDAICLDIRWTKLLNSSMCYSACSL